MSLQYFVKLEMVFGLLLSCYRKKLRMLSHLNSGLQFAEFESGAHRGEIVGNSWGQLREILGSYSEGATELPEGDLRRASRDLLGSVPSRRGNLEAPKMLNLGVPENLS